MWPATEEVAGDRGGGQIQVGPLQHADLAAVDPRAGQVPHVVTLGGARWEPARCQPHGHAPLVRVLGQTYPAHDAADRLVAAWVRFHATYDAPHRLLATCASPRPNRTRPIVRWPPGPSKGGRRRPSPSRAGAFLPDHRLAVAGSHTGPARGSCSRLPPRTMVPPRTMFPPKATLWPPRDTMWPPIPSHMAGPRLGQSAQAHAFDGRPPAQRPSISDTRAAPSR